MKTYQIKSKSQNNGIETIANFTMKKEATFMLRILRSLDIFRMSAMWIEIA